MDTFFLEAVVAEIVGKMPTGARVDKIHQPGAETFIFRLWTGREELRLLVSAEAGRSRLHLTSAAPPNPVAPPRFCQLLRARLGRVESVEKDPGERIVRLRCLGREGERYTLYAELSGTRANLILADSEGRIVDALSRETGGRQFCPGQPYAPPAVFPRRSLADPLPEIPQEATVPPAFERWLLATFAPMSPQVARDLSAAVSAGSSPSDALDNFRLQWISRESHPVIATQGGKPVLSAFDFTGESSSVVERFASPSAAAERFYGQVDRSEDGEKGQLQEVVRKGLQRLRSRQRKIASDSEKLGEGEDGRRFGDLLLANLHRVRPGMSAISVDDWYADPVVPVVIPLDPRLSPQENAERFFRGYKKRKKGAEHVQRRLMETEEELAWLEGVEQSLAEATMGEDLEAIRKELEEGGMLRHRAPSAPRRKVPDVREQLRRCRTPGGFEVVWGKNNRTNDFVSREVAAADDLWFHAHGLPGCHLVVRSGGRTVPEDDLLFAASVAAGYSRGRHDGKVEVMISEGKWVRKPKGARPGLVTVERYRTVMVRPQRLPGEE